MDGGADGWGVLEECRGTGIISKENHKYVLFVRYFCCRFI